MEEINYENLASNYDSYIDQVHVLTYKIMWIIIAISAFIVVISHNSFIKGLFIMIAFLFSQNLAERKGHRDGYMDGYTSGFYDARNYEPIDDGIFDEELI